MVSNIVEVKARGAEVIAIAYENDLLDESIFDKVIRIPELLKLSFANSCCSCITTFSLLYS